MTVNYNLCVSTSSPWSLFKILFRWKGSLWKAIYVELIIWLIAYGSIRMICIHLLSTDHREYLAEISRWADKRLAYIPLNFMLGFFVTVVVKRWGILFSNIGLIENLALIVAGFVNGRNEEDRVQRRNIVRYCVLAQVLVYRDISVQVRNRFPTIDTVVAAGFMLPHEKEKFDELQYGNGKSWMPFQWAISLLKKARDEKKITHDILFERCVEQVRLFRSNMSILTNYDWVPLPIMYPQLVFLAVHIYFLIALFARQPAFTTQDPYNSTINYFSFPLMSALQFIFYMGWMKVAEALLNPMGEDDDDFECNFLLDRNLTTGLAIVDQCYDDPPESRKDIFWSEPVEPLYSEQSAARKVNPMVGSTAGLELGQNVQSVTMVPRADQDAPKVGQFPRKSVVDVRRDSKQASIRSSSSNAFMNSLRKRISRSNNSGQPKPERQPSTTVAYDNSLNVLDETEGNLNYKCFELQKSPRRDTIAEERDERSSSFDSIDIERETGKPSVVRY